MGKKVGVDTAPTVDDSDPASAPTLGSPSGLEATLPPPGGAVAGPVDYGSLVPVEPSHYVVGDQIAKGGMGRILTARDRRLGRRVAIKELLASSPDLRARFEREARITARLEHPSIVSIHEAGTWPSGEPFYVMRLVEGQSFDKVIAERRDSLVERLALLPNVIAAVDALAYAHSQSIIHRDLKPGNILVGNFGETVVIDWGLAKDLQSASESSDPRGPAEVAEGETVAGSVMGTPAYMPAEQARGETVDERADVYALGAIMYHVISGAPPYTGRTTADILAKVIVGPPPPLDRVVEGVPPDLVTIVAKAMAHEAADRYPSAKELADDLKKFQTGQLVGAHRYTTGQLVRRWARRHRTALSVTAVFALVLATLSVLGVRRIVRERDRAEGAQRVAEQRGNEANARRAGAEKIIHHIINDLEGKLTALGKLELLAGIGKVIGEYYDGVGIDASTPDERGKRAIAFHTLAVVEGKKNNRQDALKLTERALALFSQLSVEQPQNAEWWYGRAKVLQTVSNMQIQGGLVKELAAANDAYLAASKRAHELAPSNRAYRRAYAVALASKGFELAHEHGKPLDGLAMIEQAVPLFRASTEDAVGNDFVTAWEDLITVQSGKIDVLNVAGKTAEALALAMESAKLVDELERKRPDVHQFPLRALGTYTSLGDSLFDSRRFEEALAAYAKAIEAGNRVLAIEPQLKFSLSSYYLAHGRLASTLEELGRLDEAMSAYRTGLRLAEAWQANDPTNEDAASELGTVLAGLTSIATKQKRWTDAESYATRAIAIWEGKLAGTDGKELGFEIHRMQEERYRQRGTVRLALGRNAEALADFQKALVLAEQVAKDAPTHVAAAKQLVIARFELGKALIRTGKREAGQAMLQSAVDAGEAAHARISGDAGILVALVNALSITADELPPTRRAEARQHRQRALALLDGGKLDDAEARKMREHLTSQLAK